MDKENLRSQIESILFASGEPVSVEKISKFFKIKNDECKKQMENLKAFYSEHGCGLDVIEKGDSFQMVSKKENASLIAQFLNRELNEALSPATLEVLSVIAYRGPISRAEIEQIRGVNCSFTIRNLAMRGLIERKENPNDTRAYLYEISFDFLKSLGLAKIQDLPNYETLSLKEIVEENK